jgi:hypothetical protein
MEQIIRKDGAIYYGRILCKDADDAYVMFREDYHRDLGRAVYRRLDRIGKRTERIHGFGFVRDGELDGSRFVGLQKVRYYVLGLIGIHYFRIMGRWDMEHISDEDYEDWLEWAFTKGTKALSQCGKNEKTGRTSKRLNKRYR